VYQAARSEQDTQRTLVAHLLNRAFEGSAARLLTQALASKKASREELAEIEKLIEKERGGRR
jgi:BlaI family penicillinase repressor